jgi:hypothetical protein
MDKMNGFTKVKINKFETWCCNTWDGYKDNGCNWCIGFIILGIFIVPWLLISILLMAFLDWSPDLSMGLTFFVILIIDLALGCIGLNAKDKYDYNKEIDDKSQLNLFRDFDIKYKNK